MVEMDKICHVMTIREKEVRDRDYIFSYDVASQFNSKYALLIYEHFDTMFTKWLKGNHLVRKGNPWVRRLSYFCRI